MRKIKILLVDDHELLMDGIEAIINEGTCTTVCGKASSLHDAELLVKKLQPDIVLTDISLGGASGLELTRTIQHQFPLVKVVVLSMHEDVHHIASLIRAGALGYLLKNVKQAELFHALNEAMEGRQYIQQSIASKYARADLREREADKKPLLSAREIEIIQLISAELSTAEISKHLFLSEHTVETHRKNMFKKTGAKSVVGLLNYARNNGILD